ncbi:hypothetical protein HGRIS_001375 [Hohenbuehelia grisea]|uniref:Uncharacterized protein n=1 Tax=Hohenbuehelia grisea TaxID=104357 RepID=A0ABR3JPX7_9AGAR
MCTRDRSHRVCVDLISLPTHIAHPSTRKCKSSCDVVLSIQAYPFDCSSARRIMHRARAALKSSHWFQPDFLTTTHIHPPSARVHKSWLSTSGWRPTSAITEANIDR